MNNLIKIGIAFVCLFLIGFFLVGSGTGLYFGARSVVNSVKAKYFPEKEVITEKTVDKKDVTEKDLSGKQENKKEESTDTKKIEPAGLSGYFIKDPKSGALLPIPEEMSGEFGICYMNNKLRPFIKDKWLKDYKKNGVNQYMYGTMTPNWGKVPVEFADGYAFIEAPFQTDSWFDKSRTVRWGIECWPINGYGPHLYCDDGYDVFKNSPYVVDNAEKNGKDFAYPIVKGSDIPM